MNIFSLFDLSIILIYLALVMVIGFYFAGRRGESTEEYFLAGRNVGWIAIGLSIFAANISSEHFIGLAGYGARRGLAVGNFEWLAIIFIMLLGWFFAPMFLRARVYTVPEFLGKRFNQSTRLYLSTISIVAYMVTKITVTLYAGGLLLERILGFNMYTSAVVLVVLTGIYTIAGGLGAVIYTSMIQAVFLIIGAVILTVIGLNEVGGIQALHQKLPDTYFNLFNTASDQDIPWAGIVFGAPILALWYWCTDQYIVQRVLSAKNLNAARAGSILAGFLKISPVFILVLPGLVAAVLYPGVRGDQAYPMLLSSDLLPSGLRGLVLVGLLAALMSSLSSCFNSASTLFTMDVYRSIRPEASQRKLVLIGRLSTTIIVVLAILWIPMTKLISSDLYLYLQSLQAFISPPIAAVFLFGLFWKRANGMGAMGALLAGGLIGAFRFFAETMGISNVVMDWIIEMNYLYFAIFLFAISSVTMIVCTLLCHRETQKSITGFVFKWDEVIKPALIGGSSPTVLGINRSTIIFSAALFAILIGLWSRLFI